MSLPPLQKTYTLLLTPDTIYADNTSKQKVIAIDRSYCSISLIKDYQVLTNSITPDTKAIDIDCILGIIEIFSIKYLIIVWQSELVASFQNYPIFKVKQVELIKISMEFPNNKETVNLVIENIKRLLQNGHFYYSLEFDLSQSYQNKTSFFLKNKGNIPFHNLMNYNKEFMYNYALLNSFYTFQIEQEFLCSCIYGYISMINNVSIDSGGVYKGDLLLIERYQINCIDITNENFGMIDFHCSLFKEIEVISIVNKDNIFSHLICESTIPVEYKEKMNDINKSIFFLNSLLENYNNICIISMLNSDNNNIKTKLNQLYQSTQINKDTIKFLEFDKVNTIDNFFSLTNKMREFIHYCALYKNILSSQFTTERQNGIFYLIHYDNNPSLNFMSFQLIEYLNWYYLQKQYDALLINTNIGCYSKSNTLPLYLQYSHLFSSYYSFCKYSYDNSQINKKDAMLLQNTIKYLTDSKIKRRKKTIDRKITMLMVTWNAGGIPPRPKEMLYQSNYDLSPLFTSNKFYMNGRENPDIIVIGMQEIVKLNASNILVNQNTKSVEEWKVAIYLGIKKAFQNEEYNLMQEIDLVGIMLLVYKKRKLKGQILDTMIIKNGVMGTMGNKGNCLISLKVFDTSIAMATGHYTAGQSKLNERLNMIDEVLTSQLKYVTNQKVQTISNFNEVDKKFFQEFDLWFIFGDLNFRIEQTYNEVIKRLSNEDLEYLRRYDQFLNMREEKENYKMICEGMINFWPTYKYEKLTDNFAKSGNKIRIPSWCDRILFKASSKIRVLEYNSINFKLSDHRPVYGLYELDCIEIMDNEKDIIIEEMKQIKESIDINTVNDAIQNTVTLIDI